MERKQKKDSEYWAGRLKAVKEDMEDSLDNGVRIFAALLSNQKKELLFMFFKLLLVFRKTLMRSTASLGQWNFIQNPHLLKTRYF